MRRGLWCVVACVLAGCGQAPAVGPEEPEEPEEPAAVLPSPTPDGKGPAAEKGGLEGLARTDPVRFLEACRDRTAREVHSLRGTLRMHERIDGKLVAPEVIAFSFRNKPHSVRMEWKQGAKLASRTLYVAGANDDKILVKPAGWRALAGIVRRDHDGADARASSRIPITRFGMQLGVESTLAAWKRAQARGTLKVAFGGPRRVPELGDRPVWELKRTGYTEPEDGGILESTFYIDPRTLLQVGTLLRGEGGRLIGSYYFRDLELNPAFAADAFTEAGLRR